VYRRLYRLYECVVSLVKDIEGEEPTKQQKWAETEEANKEFWNYFLENRLYVPHPLFKQTRAVGDKLSGIAGEYWSNLRREGEGRRVEDGYWTNVVKEANEEAGELFSALVAEFQRRMGVFDAEGSERRE